MNYCVVVMHLCSVEAAVSIASHTSSLVSESSRSTEARSHTLHRIALITLFILVLQILDIAVSSVGATSIASTPMMWMLVSVLIASIALLVQHKLKARMRETKGDFVLRYDLNARVRLGALQQWLRKQTLVQVGAATSCLCAAHRCMPAFVRHCSRRLQESRKGTRIREQVRITQASALRDNACTLTCVYDTTAQRILQIDVRGTSSAKTVESADYGKGLVANLMELLQNAGGLLRQWRLCQNCLVLSLRAGGLTCLRCRGAG